MKRHGKKHLAMLLAAVLTFAAVWQWMPVGVREVRAEEPTVVDTAEDLLKAFSTASADNDTAVNVKLSGSITLNQDDLTNSAKFQLTGGNLTLDLNGNSISASDLPGTNPIFSCSSGTLTIEDNSSSGDGKIISASEGQCVKATGGTLNITGGKFTDAAQCLNIAGGAVNISGGTFTPASGGVCVESTSGTLYITGGSFTNGSPCLRVANTKVNISGNPSFVTDGNGGQNDCALMVNGNSTKVAIKGGTFESAHSTVWVISSVTSESSLDIEGGTFTARENVSDSNASYSYVCSVDGTCNVNISGGIFNLKPVEGSPRNGSALVLGLNAKDNMVNISGGIFHGRIARAIEATAQANYDVFYGTDGSGGIISKGSVLTNNTFYLEYPDYNMYFTQDEVEVVPGDLIKLNTQRTFIESGADESVNWYSLDPISVGTDGTVYENTNKVDTPSVDPSKITDGNTYTFYQWYDTSGVTYDSVTDYIKNGLKVGMGQETLTATWQAETATEDGLNSAVQNTLVDSILVTGNIVLTKPVEIVEGTHFIRRLDLGGHTISYAFAQEDIAFDDMSHALSLSGTWYIRNGTIHSENAACLKCYGVATIENLDCLAVNAPYATYFEGMSLGYLEESSQILSGTFETTAETGHAIYFSDPDRDDISTGITEILVGPYVSSTSCTPGTVIQWGEEMNVIYLDASRLIVSQSPITYIGNGADLDLGSHVYGESVPVSTQVISNEAYVGDIVITGVSVDNPVFTVTGEGEPKYLRGGASQTESSYTYAVGVAENTDAGSYTGTATISYTKMDGSEGTYTQKLAVTITPKQLTIADPTITKEKVYDGTTTVQVTAGALEGVVTGDEVTVSAAASYDSADAGTGKKITVKYTLAGADQGNYLAPADTEITDGQIHKAPGSGSVSMADYHVGETAASAVVSSQTNGTTGVTYYYKQKGAADDTYTTAAPTAEGSYTVKAVFAETTNYLAVEAEADFAVSYIATPETPYTLSGTKGKNGWYTSAVVIYPPEGYTIATDVNGTYGASYTVSATAEPVIYLKDGNGALTKAIQVEKIWIDNTAPVITGVENGVTYNAKSRTAQITDENLKSVTLNGVNILFSGTTANILATSSTKEYVLVAEDDAGNVVTYKFHVQQSISSGGVSKLTKGEAYKLGSGSWTVKGDSTVYNGNVTFYVGSDGEYEFQKQ